MIDISHLTKIYSDKNGSHTALDDVSLHIQDAEIFGIVGESGAGKSTLLRCCNLLETPTSGSISFDEQDLLALSPQQMRELRTQMSVIFQKANLFEQKNVLYNVAFPLMVQHIPLDTCESKAIEALDLVGMKDFVTRWPSQLSGGQQQRVSIARAIIAKPKIILCDEPTSALDAKTTIEIINLLKSVNKKLHATIVIITHSLLVAQKLCDRIAVLENGKIVETGTAQKLIAHPTSETLTQLVAASDIL